MCLPALQRHSRRLIHFNVTGASDCTMDAAAKVREAVGYESRYAYLLHDRDTIFSLRIWMNPFRSGGCACSRAHRAVPKRIPSVSASSGPFAESLDWLIPLSDAHLRQTLKAWVAHTRHWAQASPILPRIYRCRCRSRGIDSTTFVRCMPKQHWADCTTTITASIERMRLERDGRCERLTYRLSSDQ